MFNINQFLKRFTNVTPPDSEVRKCVVDGVKEMVKIDLDKKNISVQDRVAYIKTSPAIKSRIFIKKRHLLNHIQKQIGQHYLIDIR